MSKFVRVNIFATIDIELGRVGDITGEVLETIEDCENEVEQMLDVGSIDRSYFTVEADE